MQQWYAVHKESKQVFSEFGRKTFNSKGELCQKLRKHCQWTEDHARTFSNTTILYFNDWEIKSVELV